MKDCACQDLETPRTLVKAGTVAIAGEQTGIYPLDLPGGLAIDRLDSAEIIRPE